MTSSAVLAHFEDSLDTRIHVDSSGAACGAVLTQKHPQGYRPVSFRSRKFSRSEQVMSAIERECTGLVYAVEKFQQYITGHPCTIVTIVIITVFFLFSLLFFKKKDLYLLEAPYFHEIKFQDGRLFRPMHESNYYSYPAMLDLAIFTDVLNIDQPIRLSSNDPGVQDEYFTRVRPQVNQDRMRLSVRSSLIFLIGILLAIGWLIWTSLSAVLQRKNSNEIPVMIFLVMGLSLFLGTALMLPFATYTYSAGIWLPRMIEPSIVSFGAILFVVLDRLPVTRFLVVRWVVLAMVICQSLLHISFLMGGRKDNLDTLESNYRMMLKVNPYNANVDNNLGIAYFQQGQMKKAKEYFLKAMADDPYMLEPRTNLEGILINDFEYQKSKESISKVKAYEQSQPLN